MRVFRKWRARLAASSMVVLAYSTLAMAQQDKCSDILTSGVHDTYQNISKENAKSAYEKALCDQYSSSTSSGSGTNAGVSAEGYGSVNFGQNNSTAANLAHKYCESENQNMSDDDFHSLVEVTIDPYIVENWRECIAGHSQGLYGNVDVNGDDIVFTLEWLGSIGKAAATVTSNPSITGATCDSPHVVNGTTLGFQTSVSDECHRSGNDAVTYVLNTDGGSKTLKLSPLAPAKVLNTQHYRCSDGSTAWGNAMHVMLARTDLGPVQRFVVNFTVPPPPVTPYPFKLITVYGFQLQGGEHQNLPMSTFTPIPGNWSTGDKINFEVDVPVQFTDPGDGWQIRFCIGTSNGCLQSPNLLTGVPIQE
jgi:hypothetical protein